MTAGQALLIFLGIPVGFAAIVAFLVFASGWTRSGRASDLAQAESVGGALFISTSAALPDPGRLANEIGSASSTLVGGGAHGQW